MKRNPFAVSLPFRSSLRLASRAFLLTLLAHGLTRNAKAQLITIRTVPISQAEQFDLFPSRNLGMGGVMIALPDTLADPFRNPADAARLRSPRIFGSPALYSVSGNAGAGRALPLGAWIGSGRWFGGLAVALQQVDAGSSSNGPTFGITPIPQLPPGGNQGGLPTIDPGARTHGNEFATLMLRSPAA